MTAMLEGVQHALSGAGTGFVPVFSHFESSTDVVPGRADSVADLPVSVSQAVDPIEDLSSSFLPVERCQSSYGDCLPYSKEVVPPLPTSHLPWRGSSLFEVNHPLRPSLVPLEKQPMAVSASVAGLGLFSLSPHSQGEVLDHLASITQSVSRLLSPETLDWKVEFALFYGVAALVYCTCIFGFMKFLDTKILKPDLHAYADDKESIDALKKNAPQGYHGDGGGFMF